MHYDLGFFDHERCGLEPVANADPIAAIQPPGFHASLNVGGEPLSEREILDADLHWFGTLKAKREIASHMHADQFRA